MISNKKRDIDVYKEYTLYLRETENARFDLEPMQELMLNIVYNFSNKSANIKTYAKGYKTKGTLDFAKQHISKFGITKVTKPLLWAALDALREANIVKLVRTEQVTETNTYGYKTTTRTVQYDHYQFTEYGDQLIEVAIRQAKQSTQGNALF